MLNLDLRLISGILAAACCLCAAADSTNTIDRAKALRKAGKLSEARHALEPVIAAGDLAAIDLANARFELSQIDLAEGRYPQAISNGSSAAEAYRTLHDRAGEGFGLTITGLARMYAGDYRPSLVDLNLALSIARETHDAAAEVTRLNNVGTVYYFQGDYAAALREYNAAMTVVDSKPAETWNLSRRQLTTANLATVYQRLGLYDRALAGYAALRSSGTALPESEQAQVLSNMGALYRRLGDPGKALETYRAAQALYRKNAMRSGEIAVLNNIGIAQALDLALYSDALATFNSALAMAQHSGDRPVELHALLYSAETLYRMNKAQESRVEFQKALELAIQLHAGEERWKALFGLARLALRDGERTRASQQLTEAVNLIETLRTSGPVALRAGFLADKRQVYDLLIELTLQTATAQPDALFSLIEHTRARSVQDEKKLGSLAAVRAKLPRGTLLLEYWLGEEDLAVVWANSNATGLKRATANSGLRKRLSAFAKSMADSKSEPASLQSLGSLLFEGIPDMATANNIVIVPDRELTSIPFEAIPVPGRAGRLIDCCNVSYLPTAAALSNSEHPERIWPFWRKTLLGFANPSRGQGTDPFNLPGAAALPGAEAELKDVARMIGGASLLHQGQEARKEYLAGTGVSRAPLLHLATHAMSDQEDPARSYILFAPVHPNDAFDYMFLKEVGSLNLRNTELVTLSACDSAQGKMVDGEGVQSFSTAFLNAGAKTVVASLWPVSDQATRLLMHDFYDQLAQGLPASEALRFAKRQAIQRGPKQPFYWAGFTLSGDPGLRIPRVIPAWMFLSAGLALAGLTLVTLNLKKRAKQAQRYPRSH